MPSSSTRTRKSQARDPRRLLLERLEERCLLDGAVAQLVDDQFEARTNQPARVLNVLANDDFDRGYTGDRRVTSVSYGDAGGRVELAADRRAVLYTPPPDFQGTERFVYLVDDLYAARVTVTVVSPVVADSYTVVQASGPVDLDVLANDEFWPDYTGPRQIRFVSETTAGGDLEIIDGGRRIRYTPPRDPSCHGNLYSNYDEIDEFSYFVDDGFEAKVTMRLRSPVRADQFEVVEESANNRFDVTANDVIDVPETGTQDLVNRVTSVTAPAQGGTVEITADGQGILYTPPPNFNGGDQFLYVADNLYCTTVQVVIRRAVRDDSPEIDQDSFDNRLILTGNDYVEFYYPYRTFDVVDRITSVSTPTQGGTVEITGDGQAVRYTPAPGFIGADQFDYVADGRYAGHATVYVSRPVRDDNPWVYQDDGPTRLDMLANDFLSLHSAYAGSRVITAITETSNGGTLTITEDGHALQYTPPPGFTGVDSFTYTVDGQFSAQVNLNVQSRARGDYFSACLAPTHRLSVLDNDAIQPWDQYTGPGLITAATDTSGNAAVTISDDGKQLIVQPTHPGWYMTIRYTVDGRFDAVATLSTYGNYVWSDNFTVDQNHDPVSLDVLANDHFDDGCRVYYAWNDYRPQPWQGPRSITSVSPSTNGGVVTVGADGKTVQYSPPPDFFGYDNFNYVVDGILQATVGVNVIRRVRDDRFRVAQDTTDNRLTVLINDGFGSDYTGARRITAVTATTAGGSVTISDNRTILYTPPAGFSGNDSFGYTVDGRLKAQVTVAVQPPDVLPRFESDESLEQWLIDRAVKQYSYLFDTPAYPFGLHRFRDAGGGFGGFVYDLSANYAGATFAAPSFSDTNVQVAGVDEGDIIENDGRYLYVLTGSDLVIARAWPADELSELSRLALDGTPIAMFLRGDRLTVISNRYERTPLPGYGEDSLSFSAIDVAPGYGNSWWWRPVITKVFTHVTVIDVADRAAPHVLTTADIDGNYVDSRAIGDHVYLVLDNYLGQAPQLVIKCAEPEGETDATSNADGAAAQPHDCRYESRDEYVARLHADRNALFSEALPNVTTNRSGNASETTELLHLAGDIVRPLVASANQIVSIVSLDIAAAEPHIADTEAVLTDGAAKIYGSLEHLYVFDQNWSGSEGTTTPILEFAWNDPSGDVQLVATGEVPGRMLNQFSADEYRGYLRIATTVDGSSLPGGRSHNDLFVLQDDHGILEVVAALQDVAPGETTRSMRFVGDRAFMTTFREIDPLFALDLADPANPRVVGSLHIPGFSSYMQPIDENHLLTVGLNTPNGWSGPPQVSLFDIRDMTRPILIDNYTFARFSTTEASFDHHAFGWFADHNVLAIPNGRSYWDRVDTDGDGFRETRRWVTEDELLVFRIDVTPREFSDHGIQLLGTVDQTGRVRRGSYIGDVLYSVATGSIKAVDINHPDHVIAEIDIGGADPDAPPAYVIRLAASLGAIDGSNGDPTPPGPDPAPDPNPDPPSEPGNDPQDVESTVQYLIAELPDASVSLLADPAAPDDTVLVIVGTDRNDRIVIRPARRGTELTVRVNRERFGPLDAAVVDRVLLDGRGGNDSIRAPKRFHTPVRVHDAVIADFAASESPRGNAPMPVLDRSGDRALHATGLAHLMRWRFRHRTVLDDGGRS